VSDESNHKTMMGLSPFSIDDEPRPADEDAPRPADEDAPPVVSVRVEEPPPKPSKPALDPALDPVAAHIAAKRRELALRTQRLNLDELDWDIPDDKMPRATPGPAGSTPAWDESELDQEIAAVEQAAASAATDKAGSSSQVADDSVADVEAALEAGREGAGTLLFSADTMNKMRAAAAAQTLAPSPLKAAQLEEELPPDLEVSLPAPPVSGGSLAVGGPAAPSGTLMMSASDAIAAAAAVGMAASDVPRLADDAPASSYASKGGGTESTAMPGPASGDEHGPADTPPGTPPESVQPAPGAQSPMAAPADGVGFEGVPPSLPAGNEFPVVAVAISVTVLLVLVAVALIFLTR
jgi:hypothetical protein